MILYIAGPMTGLPNLNFPAFDAAEVKLRKAGYDVINPTRHGGGDAEKSWLDYLVPCLYDVMAADSVALLPGWKNSKGARVEIELARVHNKAIGTLDFWLSTSGTSW